MPQKKPTPNITASKKAQPAKTQRWTLNKAGFQPLKTPPSRKFSTSTRWVKKGWFFADFHVFVVASVAWHFICIIKIQNTNDNEFFSCYFYETKLLRPIIYVFPVEYLARFLLDRYSLLTFILFMKFIIINIFLLISVFLHNWLGLWIRPGDRARPLKSSNTN